MADRLKAIRERWQKTTQGTWVLMPEKCGPDGQGVYHDESMGLICEVGDPYPRGDNRPQENMEFIAAAHADVPWLCDVASDLLAACKVALRAMTNQRYLKPKLDMVEEYEVVRAAITKAEGDE